MLQCAECEFFSRGPQGAVSFRCDPFGTVKEPECLAKWQILRSVELTHKVERLVAAYEATLEIYRRLGPLQEKMFRHMEKEVEELEDSDSWKYGGPPEDEDDEDDEDDEEENRRR